MRPTRRTVLGGAASLVAGGVAGCTTDGGASDTGGAFATFYTLEAFTNQIVGDHMPVVNPVPLGEMGHRYAVGSRAQLDAARSDAFVFLDIPGFQNWALETANNLRRNHPEVTLVDALAGLDLRNADGHNHGDHDEDHQQDEDHQHGENGTDDHQTESHSPDHQTETGAAGNDHGGVDPHYWLDPVLAAESVRTISEGLQTVDPSNADAYASNASAYRDELDALAETYRTELADRSHDTVVVAGHDSYQYLAERFGFSVHSPVGLSPNAEPGSAEIAETIALVDDRGIDTVLYDAFTSPRLAETIVRESNASEVRPVTPVSGAKREWDDRGWGYREQMKEINLPALKTALNVND